MDALEAVSALCAALQHLFTARYPRFRSNSHLAGLPASQLTVHDKAVIKHANRIAKNTLNLMVEFSLAGYHVNIEQPSTSLVMKLPWFKAWAHKSCNGGGC